jgi:hypothetical protein
MAWLAIACTLPESQFASPSHVLKQAIGAFVPKIMSLSFAKKDNYAAMTTLLALHPPTIKGQPCMLAIPSPNPSTSEKQHVHLWGSQPDQDAQFG